MTQLVLRVSIILLAARSQCVAEGLDDLFAPGRWQQYVAAAESALHEATAEAKTWHAASRLALAAIDRAEPGRSPCHSVVREGITISRTVRPTRRAG